MVRRIFSALLAAPLAAALCVGPEAFGQNAPGGPAEPSAGNQPLRRNSFQPGKTVAEPNKVIKPIPLTAKERDTALAGIDRHIVESITQLKDKVNKTLPDELGILSKTTGWSPEKQNALLVALRNSDPAAVFEAWVQGNPQDTAGAEIVARQTEVKRDIMRLEQDMQNRGALTQDIDALGSAIAKITGSTPAINEAAPLFNLLKTWAEVRVFVQNATLEPGPTAKLPTGKVALITNPELPFDQVIVLGPNAVMLGNQGHGPLKVTEGIVTEALGLPVVQGPPLPEAEGQEMIGGIMLINPKASQGTVNYLLNGNRYVMNPGMAQRLPEGPQWVIEYDRGDNRGMATYTVTPGTYFFKQTPDGWQLYRERFDVVIDNSQSRQEFHFVYHGENMTVPAGGTLPISGMYPIVVRYDRGNGADQAAKTMYFSGTVQVGINPADNMWDLYPTNENQREITTLKLFQ
ncbi:MAG TPA: hypothetical protein VG713_22075 [Pirellulales bacterium]|nr:hypothetical protein [Pirellulales bacterium]